MASANMNPEDLSPARGARIVDVDAVWLQVPIAGSKQHVSDFGRISHFDGVLITVTTQDGLRGYGEAKAGVGSLGNCAALVAIVKHELRPMLLDQDARQINRMWSRGYSGSRQPLAERRGRSFPVLGRRGPLIAALGGIDMALWDRLGKATGLSVLDLLGGPCRDELPAYGSGGWADAAHIGEELGGYVARGFRSVKMRLGAMDGSVDKSLVRVREARKALGPDIDIMVDAHGTFSTPEAKRFCAAAADLGLRWLEEPVSPDNLHGAAEVRRMSTIPIAAGESELGSFAFKDMIDAQAVDIVQPDLAICGGITEGQRISALATAAHLELAPHCWGSAFSFVAGVSLAFASPAAITVEVPLGGAPLLRELCKHDPFPEGGLIRPPSGPGLGLEPRPEFVREFSKILP